MSEIWLDIEGYEGEYQGSSEGRVKSLKFGRETFLKGWKNFQGYQQVILRKGGVRRTHNVHRIIAQLFIPNPKNKPCINHVNSKRADNRVENLEWCTAKENMQHCIRQGRFSKDMSLAYAKGISRSLAKLTEEDILEIQRLYAPKTEFNANGLAKRFGIFKSAIFEIIRMKT